MSVAPREHTHLGAADRGDDLERLGSHRRGYHTSLMSRFVEDIRLAMARGDLPQRFRPEDVRRACPGWASHTYGVFLPKRRLGNPGGYTEYFVQNPDGSYSLVR